MAIVNETVARRMVELARERGLDVGDWWLGDATSVQEWFAAYGVECGEALAVNSGGRDVVWLMPFSGDGANFDCRGIGGGSVGDRLPAKNIHKAMVGKAFVAWFEPMREQQAAKHAEEARAIRLGSRLCIRMKGTGDWALAMVTSLEPLSVALAIGAGTPRYELAEISDKFFSPRNRDAGFDSLWEEGKTQWTAYIAMLGSLSKRHRRVAPDDYQTAQA